MAKAKLSKVGFSLFGVTGEWVADEAQQLAAWELYVELVTRIAVQPLEPNKGVLRESLNSLHTLFGETRRILRAHGPGIATPMGDGDLSLGQIAIHVLGKIRPVLSEWHPLLLDYENSRPPDRSAVVHERSWGESGVELRKQLETLRQQLTTFAGYLAAACEIPPLHARAK